MVQWHRSNGADIGLRLSGIILCAAAWAAIAFLAARTPAHFGRHSDLAAIALAATGFLCASAGGAMAWLGRHLFDQVQTSARWRRGYADMTELSAYLSQADGTSARDDAPPLSHPLLAGSLLTVPALAGGPRSGL